MHVSYWSLVEQVAKALLALHQRLVRPAKCILGPQAFQLGPRSAAKIRMVASPRGPSNIGWSDRIARWPTTLPAESTSGTPQ